MEYNTKTRMGIWMCMLMMLLVLALVLTGVFDTAAKEADRPANATAPDEDAVYVNAAPQTTTAEQTDTSETTQSQTTIPNVNGTTGNAAAETERKALYYVTVSGNRVVLLDEYGEYLETLNENALFLPKEDLTALRMGIALYSKDEVSDLMDDLS